MKTTGTQPNKRPQMSRDETRKVVSLQRMKARRRRKILSYSALLIILVIVGVVLSLTVFFHIEKIEVVSDSIYNNESIITATEIKLQDNLFLTNTKQAAEKIEKALPYISQAKIKRHLSGKLSIELVETSAKMAIEKDGEYIFINENGKVLEQSSILSEVVSLVEGVEINSAEVGTTISFLDKTTQNESGEKTVINNGDKVLENLTASFAATQANITGQITKINLTDMSNVNIVFDGRILLKCGDATKINDTLKFASAIIKKLNEENPNYLGTINLTIEKKASFSEGDFEITTTTEPVSEQISTGVSA